MSLEHFVDIRFTSKSLAIIEQANSIIDDYRAQGFTLTLRQLYYQFVARGLLPNAQREYKRLGEIINNARLAGLTDWEMIEDRTRNLTSWASWDNPKSRIFEAALDYSIDLWISQPYRIEVWVEKEALAGVVEPTCRRWRVPYFTVRGYGSGSELWRAGHRIEDHLWDEKSVLVLHLGDHDPSGLDMTRDNEDRLRLFSRYDRDSYLHRDFGGRDFEFRRIALNRDQVALYNPPPNPAKTEDSRFADYHRVHGSESWELDALDPPVIAQLIDDAIQGALDADAWNAAVEREKAERASISRIAENWSDKL